jgi:GDPmannose 4,6-dehydratase
MSKNKALIFGVTGQDGSYLADYLLNKNYEVYGAIRRISSRNLVVKQSYEVVDADVTDYSNVSRLIKSLKPDEIYNLSAQSHVAISFTEPNHTWDVTAKGCLNILEAVRNDSPASRFFQASSSEMYGGAYSQRVRMIDDTGLQVDVEKFQDENTPFYPRSPYAIAKLAAHHATRVYRESYKLYCCSGIMFNHESPRRGENFVTRKITKYVANLHKRFNCIKKGRIKPILSGTEEKLKLGNLDVWRDWGHAQDYVEAMHRMLNHDVPDDYVIATGKTHSLTQFLDFAFGHVGLKWQEYVEIDESLRRPNEVVYCHGDYSKIKRVLKWEPKVQFKELVIQMLEADLHA